MYPHFIVIVRILFVLTTPNIVAMAVLAIENGKKVKSKDKVKSKKDNQSSVSDQFVSNFIRLLSKLAFSMHMVNYVYIKYDFANSRSLFYVYPLESLERIFYSITCIVILALPFHIFMIAPFASLRQQLLRKLT